MFEDLKVEKNVSFRTVTVSENGNPFSIKAILGEEDGQFKGASFIEVFKNGTPIPDTGIHCGPHGVVHDVKEDPDAENLTAICQKLNASIEDAYDMEFEPIPEPAEIEEPTPPASEGEETRNEEEE